MNNRHKAGRLGQSDLSAAIARAADGAKARIGAIDAAAIDAVAGGLGEEEQNDSGDDFATDGAIGPDIDIFGSGNTLNF